MRRNLLINGALLLCSIAVYFVASELITRVCFFGWDSLHPAVLSSVHFFKRSDPIGRRSAIAGLPYELIPNMSTLYKKVPFLTNGDGMRDQSYTLRKPERTFRVAVVGDSLTLPDGVAIEDAYHSLLEERFNGLQNGMHYEFLNFGVGGYDPRDYLIVMQKKVMKYDPDLILIGYCLWNDHKIDYVETGGAEKISRSVFLATLSAELKGERRNWMPRKPKKELIVPVTKNLEPRIDTLAQVLTEIDGFGREQHIPIVITSLDYRKPNEKLVALFGEHERKNSFIFFDTSEYFPEDMNTGDYILYRGDNHTNDRANRVFADALYGFLTEKKLVPTS